MSAQGLYTKAVEEGGETEEFDKPFAAFLDMCRARLIDTSCIPGDDDTRGYLGEDKTDMFQQLIKNANAAFKAMRNGENPSPHIQDVVNLAFILNELWIAEQE